MPADSFLCFGPRVWVFNYYTSIFKLFFFIFFQSVITITLDVSVTTQNENFAQAKSELEGNVAKTKTSPSMKTIQVSNTETMSLDTVYDTPTIGVCVAGGVYGLNQDVGHSQKCRKSSNACCKKHFKVPQCDYIALQMYRGFALGIHTNFNASVYSIIRE